MSIIYEALQRTQRENNSLASPLSENNMTYEDWIDVAISLSIGLLLATLMILHYPQLKNKPVVVPKVAQNEITAILPENQSVAPVLETKVIPLSSLEKQPQETVTTTQAAEIKASTPIKKIDSPVAPLSNETEYKTKHILNGVFISDEEQVAMVDNKFFNIGDTIDNMKIVSIEHDKIKLKNEKGSLELRIVI